MKKILFASILLVLACFFGTANALVVDNLVVATGNTYTVEYGGFAMGAPIYSNRTDWAVDGMPSYLDNETYIRTHTADRVETDPADFLQFDVDVEVKIYVGYDRRVINNIGMPAWLTGWIDTGYAFTMGSVNYDLYSKTFSAGAVILGPPICGSYKMYSVIIVPTTGPPPASTPLKATWTQNLPDPNDVQGWELWVSGDQVSWEKFGTIAFVSEQPTYYCDFDFNYVEGIWHFRLRAYDEVPNYSDWSSVAIINLDSDTTSPEAPESLVIEKN